MRSASGRPPQCGDLLPPRVLGRGARGLDLDEGAQQSDRVRLREHVQGHGAGLVQSFEAFAAGDQDQAAGLAGNQGPHLALGGGVVQEDQGSGTGQAGPVGRGPGVRVRRDLAGRNAERRQQGGKRVGGVARGHALGVAVQVEVQLSVREAVRQQVGRVHRQAAPIRMYHLSMNTKTLPSARNTVGDLAGLSFAILARLSNESRRRRHLKESGTDDQAARQAPRTGLDINNRDEQIADCTANIESRGGKVVFVYDEPHTSAYKRRRVVAEDGTVEYRVIRPVYRKALSDLRKGVAPNGERLDGLICPDLDRLTRDNRDLEDSIDVVQRFGRPILDNSGALDLTTESGRTNARVVTAFNNAQSAATGRRVKRKHQALQREGIPTGGRGRSGGVRTSGR
ncbi:recombinase family protein [Catenulispora yoronensis]